MALTSTTGQTNHQPPSSPLSEIYSHYGTVRKLQTCIVLSIPLYSSSRTTISSRRAPLICILPCLTLPAEDFFESLLCCSSWVKVSGECAAVAGTKDGRRVVQWYENWHYNTEVQKFALQINRWTQTQERESKSRLQLHTCLPLHEGLQKCWTSWPLRSFPFTESNFTNIIAWEQLCVITNSRQQYLPWQDPNINLSGI